MKFFIASTLVMIMIGSAAAQNPAPEPTQFPDIVSITMVPSPPFDFLTDAKNKLKSYYATVSNGNTDTIATFASIVDIRNGAETGRYLRVDKDGNLTMQGDWSDRDWLLMLAADQAEKYTVSHKKFEEELKASKDVPPVKIETSRGPWKVKDVTRWDEYTQGDSNCRLNRIRTVSTSSDKHLTMLHEMMHVASGCDQDEQLHRAIQQISPKLLKLLRDNPEMVEWMLSDGTSKPKAVANKDKPGTFPYKILRKK